MITVSANLHSIIFRLALLNAVLVITWLAFTSFSAHLNSVVGDKALHVITFVTLAYLLEGAFPQQSVWVTKVPALIVYGFFIEVMQWEFSFGVFSLVDFSADVAGVLLYWVCHKPIWGVSGLVLAKVIDD